MKCVGRCASSLLASLPGDRRHGAVLHAGTGRPGFEDHSDEVEGDGQEKRGARLPGPRQPPFPRPGDRRVGPHPRPRQRPRAAAGRRLEEWRGLSGSHAAEVEAAGPGQPIAFVEDDEAPIGKEPPSAFGKGGPRRPRTAPAQLRPRAARRLPQWRVHKLGPPGKVVRKPTQAQPSGPKSPPPKAASDSDVRLVADGSDLDFQVDPAAPKSSAPKSPPPKSAPPGKSAGTRKTHRVQIGQKPRPGRQRRAHRAAGRVQRQ